MSKATGEAGDVTSAIMDDINKAHGAGSALALSDGGLSIHIPGVIPSGSPWMDWALGRGGWPLSRICLVGGDEGTGKTTLALQACAAVQAIGGVAFYIDAEYKLDMMYADSLGVDVDKLVMSQPRHMEQALDMCERAIKRVAAIHAKTGRRIPVLVVFDSISSIPPKGELEGSMDDVQVGLAARIMGKGLRKLVQLVSQESVCLMLVSQLREKIGVMFGDNLSTGCGKAPLFYSAVIARLGRGKRVKDGKDSVGGMTHVYVHKNQVAPPHRKSELRINYGEGIDWAHGLHHVADKSGWASLAGSWKVPPDGSDCPKWQGLTGLQELAVEDQARIEAAVREHYGTTEWGESL